MTLIDALPVIADELDRSHEQFAALDSVAGDGDLGITAQHIAGVLRSVHARSAGLEAPDVLENCALNIAEAAPSSFGTLVSFALLAAAAEVRSCPQTAAGDAAIWQTGLRRACEAVSQQGGARAGQKTVLDAALPAVDALEPTLPLPQALAASAAAAAEGAQQTAAMKASVGRAGWSAERSQGNVDAGAQLFAVAWAALAKAAAR